jgi:hypothetical protein
VLGFHPRCIVALPNFPPFAPLDVEVTFARLPAEARAGVTWARKPIETALSRLRTEPLTDELVADVATSAWKPLASFALAAGKFMNATRDELRARIAEDIDIEERQLAEFVGDEESRDTLRWVIGILREFMGLALSVPPEVLQGVDPGALDPAGNDPEFAHYLRGLLTLMAAHETRKVGGDSERLFRSAHGVRLWRGRGRSRQTTT